MKTNAGLWIDHREAIIVTLTDTGEDTHHIHSNVERHFGHLDESGNGTVLAPHAEADDAREREYTGHLAPYYDDIIAHVVSTDSLLIFGPGEAKVELRKRFNRHPHGGPTITLETTDRMTEPQIVALVRHHFHRDPVRQETSTHRGQSDASRRHPSSQVGGQKYEFPTVD